MRGTYELLIVIATLIPLGSKAQGIVDIIDDLKNADGYQARVRYEVTMPAFGEPVVYDVEISQAVEPGDTLAPCNYLIQWTVPRPGGVSRGWSAYGDGHHYRFRDDRLQEYHLQWDSIPFGLGGHASQGVQSQAQFTELLPSFIAREIETITTDTTYTYVYRPDTIVGGIHRQSIDARRRFKGYDVREWTLIADRDTSRPVMIEIENNPGSISEQSLTIAFTDLPDAPLAVDEESLSLRFPDDFARFRESYFRAENLPGSPLPRFALPTADGTRYIHDKNSRFGRPTIVALLDARVGDPATVVSRLRQAVDTAPTTTDIIWAFLGSNVTEASNVVGGERPGESTLINARSLARDCGVTDTPTIIIANPDGVVADVIIGANKDVVSDVIQKIALMR